MEVNAQWWIALRSSNIMLWFNNGKDKNNG